MHARTLLKQLRFGSLKRLAEKEFEKIASVLRLPQPMICVQQFRAHGVKLLYISNRRQKYIKF